MDQRSVHATMSYVREPEILSAEGHISYTDRRTKNYSEHAGHPILL